MEILTHYDANLFQGENVVRALIFLVVTDASFDFADGGSVWAGEATAELHDATAVDVAEALFVFWVA